MKKPTVLLVEDDEDDAFIFNWRFEQAQLSCAVHHVLDGASAIEFLNKASANPDALPMVIFLDLKMPVMNGFEVLRWLREHDTFCRIPVIVLSGSDQQSDKDRASGLGAAEYWVKPVQTEVIQRYLGGVCSSAAEGVALDSTKVQK
jgi:two-component system response regulator